MTDLHGNHDHVRLHDDGHDRLHDPHGHACDEDPPSRGLGHDQLVLCLGLKVELDSLLLRYFHLVYGIVGTVVPTPALKAKGDYKG